MVEQVAKYQRYAEYKDSGVEWLGEIPIDWVLTRVKFEAYVKARVGWHGLKSDDFKDEGPYLVTGSDFKGTIISWKDCYHCDLERYKQDPYIQLKNGDLLITKDGTIGKLALVEGLKLNEKATLNSGVFVVRPLRKNFSTKFYFWLLQSTVFKGFVNHNKTGTTILHLYQDTFVNFDYASPILELQVKIANFLDHETAKIDGLIEKQKQLIQLLKEKRQAVISHAVTKGLDPSVKMKDSGVEWLGEVPEHWIVSTLKYYVNPVNGFGFSSSDVCEHGVPFIRAGNIKKKSITPTDLYLPQRVVDKYKRVILFEGDIVISMVGSDPRVLESAVGQVGVVPKSMAGSVPNQNIVILREKSELMLKRFLFYTLCGDFYRNHLNVFSHNLANQSIISSSLIVTAKFLLPSHDEQFEIVEFLDQRLAKMDQIILKNYGSLMLLQERRTALISAAVTGKIDVRNWQNPIDAKTELSA